MIEIVKGSRPEWFDQNQETSTAAYMEASSSKKPSPWRTPGIVTPLKNETRGKCMYCEVFIDDASYSAVEHIRPKSVFPHLVLDWSNLGIACQRCNTNKSDYWTEDAQLQVLNPYVDHVRDHLEFIGPVVVSTAHSSRGVNTIRKLKFDEREDLVLSKMKRIQELEARIRLWHGEANETLKELLAEDVVSALDSAREFAGTLRAYATLRGFAFGEGAGDC